MQDDTRAARLALILSENGRFRAQIALECDPFSIGRRRSNNLVLDDLTVSGEHALIQVHPDGCLIRDLKSRNGTQVNGRPVDEHLLAVGDSIDIGIYRLRLVAEPTPGNPGVPRDGDAQPAVSAGFIQTGASADPRAGRPHAGALPAAVVSSDREAAVVANKPAASPEPARPVVASHDSAAAGGVRMRAGSSSSGARAMALAVTSADISPRATLRQPVAAEAAPASAPDGPTAPPGSAGRVSASVAVAEAELPRIEYLSGPHAGISRRLDRNLVRIGDGDSQAAVIARRRSGYFMTRLEGMGAPTINGQAIGPAASPLADGDLIELAGLRIRFRLSG